jgi:hypothetical protein
LAVVPKPKAATPEGVLAALTESAAEGVMNWFKALEGFRKDFPDTRGVDETQLAFRVAALALIEGLDIQQGRTPITQLAKEQAA